MKKIYIEITNNCNLQCSFCKNTDRAKQYMTTNQFEEIIKKVKDYTKIVCLHVKGEPLLHPELDNLLAILEKYNMKANITTNGIMLNKLTDVLVNSKSVRQINISLHCCIENPTIDVSKYMENILNVVSILENSNIIISLRLWNLKTIKENTKNFEIIKAIEEKYKITNLSESLMNNQWLKLKENLYINQDIEFVWPNLNNEIINQNGRCLAIKEQLAILVNGDVVPCCIDSEGNIVLGNIYNQTISEILKSDKAQKMLLGFQNNELCEELCKRCGFLKRLENKRQI